MFLLKRIIAWLGSIATAVGLGYIAAKIGSRKDRKIERLEAEKKTTEDIQDADRKFEEIVGNDAAAAREWLRRRKP